MKVYVKRENKLYNVVVFVGDHVMAKTGILGQELGSTVEKFTNGAAFESLDDLPEGISVKNGSVFWKR